MEPDRWAEEQRRGMTIDLGFAWTTLPSGARLAFVDVPGHRRFIGNMLAGLGPVPAVMFVVAADEGWRQQSAEHLAAIDALDVRSGLLVVTRSDLADPQPAIDEAQQQIAGSSLGLIPSVAVSGTTGAGVPELRQALDAMLAGRDEPTTMGRVRLWIDRSFTIKGSGTVVTATLASGNVGVGDELVLGERRVRVRSVQSLGEPAERVAALARVALNLRGVAPDEIGRGDVLLTPDAWHQSVAVDVRLSVPATELPTTVTLHLGTAHLSARVRPLAGDLARIVTNRPLPWQPGDRAILRDPAGSGILAGLRAVDVDPPALGRRRAGAEWARQLNDTEAGSPVAFEVARRGAVRASHLRRLGIAVDDVADAGVVVDGDWLISSDQHRRWIEALPYIVDSHREANPVAPWVPLEVARRALAVPDIALLAGIVAAAGLTSTSGGVERLGMPADLGPAEAALQLIERRLAVDPFAAPDRNELDQLGLTRRELAAAERAGRLIRITDEIVLLPDAPQLALDALRSIGSFSPSQARQALGSTRRVVIPLLEYLDAHGYTRRDSDGNRTVTI
jgi:selenocysteine-specific elongation factor